MRVITSLDAIDGQEFAEGCTVAIGKFDGLHRGHQAILEGLRASADADGVPAVVFTFANHPLSYLQPEACPLPLMSRQQRLEAFAALGIDDCVMVPFDDRLAQIPAETFVERVLVGQLHATHIILGGDFRFGHRGLGDAALLRVLAPRLGFTVEVIDWVADPDRGQLSSSRVREAITAGDVTDAAEMLGRPVSVRGEVVHGDARGRELGFPTANLGGAVEGLVPADGVYAGHVLIGGELRPAAISVGNNPTFTPDGQPRVEAFLLDFSGDLYGAAMEVRFVERLRGTVAFDSLDALIVQMNADVARTREVLAG